MTVEVSVMEGVDWVVQVSGKGVLDYVVEVSEKGGEGLAVEVLATEVVVTAKVVVGSEMPAL